ncbi:MAG: hypothetical protein EZS28_022422 [Streblomastix strix]|uniref:Uncharacterized protein n=1 Tax=Streblomastix strix TaxID=222440 RepID=A0A5J4VHW8_9EUKA|nr:MAG: hypothetical protein EZS28_022422 [Streblomastix strix]
MVELCKVETFHIRRLQSYITRYYQESWNPRAIYWFINSSRNDDKTPSSLASQQEANSFSRHALNSTVVDMYYNRSIARDLSKQLFLIDESPLNYKELQLFI